MTSGAITHWENGERPIPGPVQKLIQLYENFLEGELPQRDSQEIRQVATSWTRVLLSTIDLRKRKKLNWDDHLKNQIETILHRELSSESWKRQIQLNALERMVQTIGKEKGLPMKLAQLASYLDLGIPQEFRDALATLQFLSSPMAPTVAARVFYEAFDRSPREAFSEWGLRPFAAASIGQVHAAKDQAGRRLAVKIQYPGIQESLQKDFHSMERYTKIAALLKRGDSEALEEVKTHVLKECDYRIEADRQEAFYQYFKDHPTIVIPRVIPELSSVRVLTQEYMEGLSFQDFLKTASVEDKREAARTISAFYTHGFFLSGLLHTDPHPGNFLFQGKKVVFLDFGRTTQLKPEEGANFHRIWRATVDDEKDQARAILKKMDVVKDWDRFDFDAFWDVTRSVHIQYLSEGEFEMTEDFVKTCMKTMQSFPQKREIKSPSAFFWGNMVHLSLWNILALLGAKRDWMKDMEEIEGRMQLAKGRYLRHWNDTGCTQKPTGHIY